MIESGEKPVRIRLDNFQEKFERVRPEMLVKLGAETTKVTIFNKIKESIISSGQSTHIFLVNFNMMRVLNNEKLPLYKTTCYYICNMSSFIS